MSEIPPPPAPPTPKLYMTPILAKRKDGLCPSMYNPDVLENVSSSSKVYRTNSYLLKNLGSQMRKEGSAGSEVEAVEFQTITGAIRDCIKDLVGSSKSMVSSQFQPHGCTWTLDFNPKLNGANINYLLSIVCSAKNEKSAAITEYFVNSKIVSKNGSPDGPLPSLRGLREAKGVLEITALELRKAVVKLELPEFPEGRKGGTFREAYQLNARLKSGSFATVCRGTHRATGKKVAIKCVLRKDLPPSDDAAIFDEVAILSALKHPHIVPIIDFFDEQDCYFIVMELMIGGDLFDRIGKKKVYHEADARDLIVKMIKSVAYCHSRKIAHCDMKPKNLLLLSEDNDNYIKLADFGFAARVHEPKSLSKQCGTPFFVAPEILMRKPYDEQSDMWSVGCIVFLLLSGNLPFMGRSQKELFRNIVSGKYNFGEDDWANISDDAKDLVKNLLVLNPDNRLTSTEALRHKWLKTKRDQLTLVPLSGTVHRIKTFNARMKLRSAMIAVDWVSSLKRNAWLSGDKNVKREITNSKQASIRMQNLKLAD